MFDLENSPPRNKKFAEKKKNSQKEVCVAQKAGVVATKRYTPTLEVLAVEANSDGFLEDSSGWLVLCMYLKIGGSKKILV